MSLPWSDPNSDPYADVVEAKMGIAQVSRVETLLDDITNGVLDAHLEALLAAAHGRKRAKRGVRNARGLSRA